MDLYKAFSTDTKHEQEGIDIQYGVNSKGEPIKFRIARAGGSNKKFERAVEEALQPYRRQVQTGTMDPEVDRRLMVNIYAKSIILGWSGVHDREGKALPYSQENVIKLMTDLPELFRDIQGQASNLALFRDEVLENDTKN